METGFSESDERVLEFDGSYGIFGVGECETECEEVEARVSEVKADDLRFGGGNGDADGGTIADEVRFSSEPGSIEEKLGDKASNGGNDHLNGGGHSETRVSYGGRKSGMEVVKGESGGDFSSSHSVFHDIGYMETSEMVLEAARGLSYQFEVGDMVWGKVKSHPWWPGHIFNEEFASASVRRMRYEGHVLVAFFGDSSYGWFDPTELIPFEPHFAEKSKQTISRSFGKAVEEAVDEVSRRSALGLACRCRFPFNFRHSSVQRYFVVDVFDYEPGGVYSLNQIKKARDSFRPAEALSFVQQLALMPGDGDHQSIDQIKNISILLAYRKAVFEEFDDTYAQAFGVEPVHPSRNASGELDQPDRVLPRAPLSGPLVIAEDLGERKRSVKSLKAKNSSKKDKYQFKRRDEPNEKGVAKRGLNQASRLQIPSLTFKEASASFPSRAGDHVLQKRAPVFPEKHSFPMKQEERKVVSQGQGVPVTVLGSVESQGRVSATVLSGDFRMRGGVEEEKLPMQPVLKERDASLQMTGRIDTDRIVRTTSRTTDLGKSKSLDTGDGIGRAVGREVEAVSVGDGCRPDQVMEDSHVRSLSVPADGPLDGDSLGTPSGNAVVGKTSKARKRPFEEEDLSLEKHVVGEKKKKKKKDPTSGTSLDQRRKQPKIVKDRETLRKLAGKSIGIGSANEEHLQIGSERKAGTIFDSANMLPKLDIVNVELKLPQLVNDLLDIAVNPFHAIEHDNSAVVRHVFLKFRSRVYQKSLVLPPTSEPVVSNPGAAKSVTIGPLTESSAGNAKPASKSLKQLSRFEDPTKVGQKRGPSERQEELAEKRLKKLKKMKLLATEKKASNQKDLDGQKETGASAPVMGNLAKTEPPKKPELPPKKITPTSLVMKFPPKITLPSAMQLKARFARFGPLDESGTRIYWKSLTCKVVFKHKSDAQAAYDHAIQNNSFFGQVRVRYFLRELNPPTSELPKLNEGQVNDDPENAPSLRLSSSDIVGEQRQPSLQLKSCLKRPPGDEAGPTAGLAKDSPRVKFLLVGEESRGEQMMMAVNTSLSNTGSTAYGEPSSPMIPNVNLKNIQAEVIPPSQPQLLPSRNTDLRHFPPPPPNFLHQPWIPPRLQFFHPPPDMRESRGHFSQAPQNATLHAQYKEGGGKESMVDISHQMLSLLWRCSDIVSDIKSAFGYVPYRPL